VRHFNDSVAHDRVSSLDRSSGVELSPDTNVETSSNDHSGMNKSPKDQSSVDQAEQS
jgi:hypothetical protein